MSDSQVEWMKFSDSVELLFKSPAITTTDLSVESKKLYEQDRQGWYVSRKRLVVSALAAYDIDLLASVFREYVAIVGHKKAVFAVMKIWERAVAREIATDQHFV